MAQKCTLSCKSLKICFMALNRRTISLMLKIENDMFVKELFFSCRCFQVTLEQGVALDSLPC